MNEIWKVVTVNCDYEVSNFGNVRSNKCSKQRLLKPFKRGSKKTKDEKRGNYLSVRLLSNGMEADYAVHRLVAMAFIPNPNNLPQVNHINGIRNDNRADNLEWCDNSYNVWHSYNVLGNTNGLGKSVCQYNKNGEFIKEWDSASSVEKEIGIDSSSILYVCKKDNCRKLAGGFIWRYKGDEDVALKYDKTSSVVQISKYGEYLKTFDSVQQAASDVGITIGGISGVCMKKERGYNYAGGYLWRYKDEYNEKEFGYYLDKTFIQMTNNNIFVAEYKGTRDLVDNSGCELIKVIMCCRGERTSTNGFKWCIKEECDKTRITKREKPVVQLSKDFAYINEYKSGVAAAKENKTHSTHIGDSCKTKGKRTSGGFRWMYKDDYVEYLKENKE